jgi:glycosyltransferase involved in cell wall biosynthesis
MACGVPVVGSIVGGLPELVTNGEVGYLEPIGDVGAMARRSLDILSDNEMHRRMSKRAREITVEKFTTEKIVGQYKDFYRKVLEDG